MPAILRSHVMSSATLRHPTLFQHSKAEKLGSSCLSENTEIACKVTLYHRGNEPRIYMAVEYRTHILLGNYW